MQSRGPQPCKRREIGGGDATGITERVDRARVARGQGDARGERFRRTVHTLQGRTIEAQGQAVGGQALLRLRELTGERQELVELRATLEEARHGLGTGDDARDSDLRDSTVGEQRPDDTPPMWLARPPRVVPVPRPRRETPKERAS